MITVELAQRLRDTGLTWLPEPGDRFAIPERDLDGEVFVVSHMTIDAVQINGSDIVRFNGTTEWALDSIELSEVVWLPHESQLRALLGPAFRTLTSTEAGYAVEVREPHGLVSRHVAGDAECAYALALLAVLV
ncbi:pilus assembly protein CpaE [Nocardioides mesophilus]|uniref:Pilus assembly protein CpaE n=1 Tax=Nocardioides mesophilus TaxID=433659 RepID=A0A7G9RFX1_9ACTN|nr:pilus assembly protein CpaE [Nocardioides mesophilus]QNN54496.1 pilus assembly protein CpaE [Nocardioides mesophilus]